jgi:hypothetical protein
MDGETDMYLDIEAVLEVVESDDGLLLEPVLLLLCCSRDKEDDDRVGGDEIS